MTFIQIMYVPGQLRVGVTPVCLIVMLHIKTHFYLNILQFFIILWFLGYHRHIACSQLTYYRTV